MKASLDNFQIISRTDNDSLNEIGLILISNSLLFPLVYSEVLASSPLIFLFFPFTSVLMISQYHSQNFLLCFILPSLISLVSILYFFLSSISRFSTFGCLLHTLVYPLSIDFKHFLWFNFRHPGFNIFPMLLSCISIGILQFVFLAYKCSSAGFSIYWWWLEFESKRLKYGFVTVYVTV